MRLLLADSITSLDPGKRITGTKNPSMSEDFFTHHFPQRPIMPGMLILESMVQLARWLVASTTDFTAGVLLTGVRECKFRGFAVPGDQIVVDVEELPGEGEGREFRGVARVQERRIVTASFQAEDVRLAELMDVDAARHLLDVLRTNGDGARRL